MTSFLNANAMGMVFWASVVVGPRVSGQEDQDAIVVDLKLRTGGAISGAVVEHDDHGLVIVHDNRPYVFAWTELEPGSAYVARHRMLTTERGGENGFSAKDHFQLGRLALEVGRKDLAARQFRRAADKEGAYAARASRAFAEAADTVARAEPFQEEAAEEIGVAEEVRGPVSGDDTPAWEAVGGADDCDDLRGRVMDVYRSFGQKVQQVLGEEVQLVETEHFLIWTDWPAGKRGQLGDWCERMYAALCRQFGLADGSQIFLAKCPVFAFRAKPRFEKFARRFDGYDGKNAIGYTRSIQENGHTHVVLLHQGRSSLDLDRFACTLVHEGSHAFVHRLYGTGLIPHWVNEGLAELTAHRVLGERCPGKGNAALLARCYVQYDWPLGDFLERVEPIGVEQYALAHSVVAYLESLGRERFAAWIKGLKAGQSTPEALPDAYGGLTLGQLESRWREWVQDAVDVDRGTASGKETLPVGGRGERQ